MRALLAAVLLASPLLLSVPGCTPYIPVKDDFGTSALVPAGSAIPAEFAEFNAYDKHVNTLLAQQLCATPYQPLEERSVGAAAGRLDEMRGRCRTHVPLYGE